MRHGVERTTAAIFSLTILAKTYKSMNSLACACSDSDPNFSGVNSLEFRLLPFKNLLSVFNWLELQHEEQFLMGFLNLGKTCHQQTQ
jgi:hypothetical protein